MEVQIAHVLQSDKNYSQGGAKPPALHLVLPRLRVPGQCSRLFADEPAAATGRVCNSRSPSGPARSSLLVWWDPLATVLQSLLSRKGTLPEYPSPN